GPLADAFTRRLGRPVETASGVAATTEMPVLVANRLADVALGPDLMSPGQELVSEPVFRCKLIAVSSPRGGSRSAPPGPPASWQWLVDPSGIDPASDTSRLLRRLGVPESRVMVFPNQTAAWAAAADGDGVAPGVAHLLSHQLRRGELRPVGTPAPPMGATRYAPTLPPGPPPPVGGPLRPVPSPPQAVPPRRGPPP